MRGDSMRITFPIICRQMETPPVSPRRRCSSAGDEGLCNYLLKYAEETGNSKYVSGYGSFFREKCHHSQSIG